MLRHTRHREMLNKYCSRISNMLRHTRHHEKLNKYCSCISDMLRHTRHREMLNKYCSCISNMSKHTRHHIYMLANAVSHHHVLAEIVLCRQRYELKSTARILTIKIIFKQIVYQCSHLNLLSKSIDPDYSL